MMTFLSSILPGGVLLSASSSSPFSFWGKICNSITKNETDIKGRVEKKFHHQASVWLPDGRHYKNISTFNVNVTSISMLPAFQCCDVFEPHP